MSGDIFLTFFVTCFRSPAGPQDIFLTFFGHFASGPNDPTEIPSKTFFRHFSANPGNPICSGLAHRKRITTPPRGMMPYGLSAGDHASRHGVGRWRGHAVRHGRLGSAGMWRDKAARRGTCRGACTLGCASLESHGALV